MQSSITHNSSHRLSQFWQILNRRSVRGHFLHNDSRCVNSDIRTVSMIGSNVQSETIVVVEKMSQEEGQLETPFNPLLSDGFFPKHSDTISMGLPILYRSLFPNYGVFLSLGLFNLSK